MLLILLPIIEKPGIFLSELNRLNILKRGEG